MAYTEQLQRIKEIELDILKSFLYVCEKLNLKYYLMDGTLLGAVRHKGFIPWDDDIDIGMMRADYEIFIREAQKYLPEYYFLQTRQTDLELPMNYAKIRDSRTTFLETALRDKKMNHGIFIDVFPLDYYPNETTSKIFHIQKMLLEVRIMNLLYKSRTRKVEGSIIRKIRNKIVVLMSYIYCPSSQAVFSRKEKLIRKYHQCNYIANFGGPWEAIVPYEWYGEGCILEFEGLRVQVPIEYDKWLTKIFGDYMQFPPVEARVSTHCTDVIDTEKSYLEYVD